MHVIDISQLDEKTVKLTAEELAAVDEGLLSEQTEPIYTLDEAFEFARKQRKEWKKPEVPREKLS